MLCWKLQFTTFNAQGGCELEIGVIRDRQYFGGWNNCYYETVEPRWPWCCNTLTQSPFRLDSRQPSITSVQDNGIFTVFVNLVTEKLVICNSRSRLWEMFTGVQGNGASTLSIVSCQSIIDGYNDYVAEY